MQKYFAILDRANHYKKEYWNGELSAGFSVGVMLVPQGMAYAMLAGLPPIYGLYASTIPLILIDFIKDLKAQAIAIYLVNVKGIVRDVLFKSGPIAIIGKYKICNNLDEDLD